MKKLIIIFLMMCGIVYAGLTGTEGLAIDLSSAGAGTDFTIAFDPTEFLGSRTWGDGSTDTIVWTWNRATGTDPTMTFNSGGVTFQTLTAASLIGPLTGNADTVTTNANLTGEVTSVGNAATIADSIAVTSWNLTTPTITTSLTTSTPTTLSVAELDRLDGLAGIIVTDATAVTDLEGTGLSIAANTLNWAAASTDLTDTAALMYLADFDTFAKLDTQIADKALVNKADGAVWSGVHDFGGATSLEIPNGTDPDVTVVGQISNDTDGGNETGDVSIRAFDGTNQFLVSRKLKTLNFTLLSPSGIDAKDFIPIWHNNTGMTFTVVEWKGWSNIDDVLLDIVIAPATDYTDITTVDAVTIDTNGTGVFYGSDTTITAGTIAADSTLAIDFGATAPEYVQLAITGWFNSDVD